MNMLVARHGLYALTAGALRLPFRPLADALDQGNALGPAKPRRFDPAPG